MTTTDGTIGAEMEAPVDDALAGVSHDVLTAVAAASALEGVRILEAESPGRWTGEE